MKTDITGRLRALPELEPPAGTWSRIGAEWRRERWRQRRNRLALAASLVFLVGGAAVVGNGWLGRPGLVGPLTEPATVPSLIVSAPFAQAAPDTVDAELRALQRRSRYMERLLGDLPSAGRIASADTAGVIAELEDRIAAVDYQLNRAEPGYPDDLVPGSDGRHAEPAAPELWRTRVEYMDQLVRAHYVRADIQGF